MKAPFWAPYFTGQSTWVSMYFLCVLHIEDTWCWELSVNGLIVGRSNAGSLLEGKRAVLSACAQHATQNTLVCLQALNDQ